MNLKRIISVVFLGAIITNGSLALEDELIIDLTGSSTKIIDEEENIIYKKKEYVDYYVKALIKYNRKENEARALTDIYIQERREGKSRSYAEYYSVLKVIENVDDSLARIMAELYIKEIKDGKDHSYASCYVELVVRRGIEKDKARREIKRLLLYKKYGGNK